PGVLAIVLAQRCNAKVELGDPARADEIQVLDAQGERLDLYEIGATGITYRKELALIDGRSVTFGVSEEARTLVLRQQGVEVARLPLQLSPERLNLLGP